MAGRPQRPSGVWGGWGQPIHSHDESISRVNGVTRCRLFPAGVHALNWPAPARRCASNVPLVPAPSTAMRSEICAWCRKRRCSTPIGVRSDAAAARHSWQGGDDEGGVVQLLRLAVRNSDRSYSSPQELETAAPRLRLLDRCKSPSLAFSWPTGAIAPERPSVSPLGPAAK